MSPDAIARLLKTVALIVLSLALWWAWDSFVDWVRAPVVAELDKAASANKSLVSDLDREKARGDRLAIALAARQKREASLDRKFKGVEDALRALKKADPAVAEWTATPIPPALLVEPAK